MANRSFAKLFRNGRSQAVRLPQEFRFEGDRVRIRRVRDGVLFQPIGFDTRAWFETLDRLNCKDFSVKGRSQPVTPRRKIFD